MWRWTRRMGGSSTTTLWSRKSIPRLLRWCCGSMVGLAAPVSMASSTSMVTHRCTTLDWPTLLEHVTLVRLRCFTFLVEYGFNLKRSKSLHQDVTDFCSVSTPCSWCLMPYTGRLLFFVAGPFKFAPATDADSLPELTLNAYSWNKVRSFIGPFSSLIISVS